MSLAVFAAPEKSRLRALLDHFAIIEDPREPWRVAHPLPEVLLLVVCGTIADCDDYEGIAEWGDAHLGFLRRFQPYHHGVPGARWLTILMNRQAKHQAPPKMCRMDSQLPRNNRKRRLGHIGFSVDAGACPRSSR